MIYTKEEYKKYTGSDDFKPHRVEAVIVTHDGEPYSIRFIISQKDCFVACVIGLKAALGFSEELSGLTALALNPQYRKGNENDTESDKAKDGKRTIENGDSADT